MDKEAIQALETTVAMAPKMRVAYKWLAELYFKDGRDPEKPAGTHVWLVFKTVSKEDKSQANRENSL